MRSRLEMIREIGAGRALSYAGTSLAFFAAMSLGVLVINRPAETGQALINLVAPLAQASALPPDQPSTSEALPTSVQARSWDKVEYGEHDFDPPFGQIED